MNYQFRRKLLAASLMAVGSGIITPAIAQSSGGGVMALEEIVVTARRREESLQDVPLTVNAVTSETIDDLNVRKLEDIQGIVAGLTLQENTTAPNASLRGVRFDTFISGNEPTVEFYLNDAPISIASALQAMFDVSQIEVLRGPQGTLRGRASPSGSITITTQKPILDEFGGYVDATINNRGENFRGALNIPIIENVLGIRIAGFWEENDANDATSINSGESSEYEGKGYRFSVGFEPTENLVINAQYQMLKPTRTDFAMVESAHLANPSLTPSAGHRVIRAGDRKSVLDVPSLQNAELERFDLSASWEFSGQALNYVGSKTEQYLGRFEAQDTGDVFSSAFPAALQSFGQNTQTNQKSESHELRLQSVEPLFGIVDYVVGVLDSENTPATPLINRTALFAYFFNPATFATVVNTPIFTGGTTEERSYFGNLNFHIGDDTELSVGGRRLEFEQNRTLLVQGNELLPEFEQNADEDATIFSASLKHQFTDDIMAYASYGESFRLGGRATGDFSLFQTQRELDFVYLDPEESDSVELGIKSTWLDDRLRLNATVFQQQFDNYPYRVGGGGVYYANFTFGGFGPNGPILVPLLASHNFGAAVPVEVNGLELEAFFQVSDQWDVGALFSYAKGEIEDGTIPCNDYLPADGMPDAQGVIPTVNDILAAGDHVGSCSGISQRSNYTPLWTGTLTSEYSFDLGGTEAYIRGLWTFYGNSKNDPTNSLDDVDSYNILNLYAGLKDPGGSWEVMIYGKNIADTEEVIERNANPASQSYQLLLNPIEVSQGAAAITSSGTGISEYRLINLTAPREFGLNVRYYF